MMKAPTTRRRLLLLVVWLVVVLGALPFASRQSEHLTSGGYMVPNSQSASVAAIVRHDYPSISRNALAILLWPRTGASSTWMRRDIQRVEKATAGISGLLLPARARELALFAAGLVGPIVMPLEVTGSEADAQAIAEKLRARLHLHDPVTHRIEIHLLGEGALWAGLNEASKEELARAELIGLPILFIVLLAIFGSLATAALPLILGVVAVTVTGALIYFLSLATELSVFVTNTASMLGIGVAVDYSLIILSRTRQELADGESFASARHTALRTSGRAVVFSGLTVMASLIGIFVIPIGTVRSMALGAIVVVAVSVLVAMSLLPVLMELLGPRRLMVNVLRGRRATIFGKSSARMRRLGWEGWTNAVVGHPVLAILTVGGLLLILCIPAVQMHTHSGALDQLKKSSDTHVGFTEAAKLEGPGALGPIYVVVQAQGQQAVAQIRQQTTRVRTTVARTQFVRGVGPAQISPDGSRALFVVTPTVAPESTSAKQLVSTLRLSAAHVSRNTGLTAIVGGSSATQLDEEHAVAVNMWKLIAAVLALAFVVLAVVLRSLVLPLKAIMLNLLSVGAAYGVLVIVFQWGWLDSLTGFRDLGYLDTFTPPLILAIVFGLSMDYEVFLLTRIKERWLATGDAHRAVAEGLAASAQTITSAAFILVCVFAVFVGTGTPSVKELGLGAAVAIGIDATLIRLILVPAAMELLGERNWWLPAIFTRRRSSAVLASAPTSGR
jgi:uncharacterized membrane protein YdfJ with MMPL/SSD domain